MTPLSKPKAAADHSSVLGLRSGEGGGAFEGPFLGTKAFVACLILKGFNCSMADSPQLLLVVHACTSPSI